MSFGIVKVLENIKTPVGDAQYTLGECIDTQNLKFVNKSNNPDPVYANDGDSGFDLRAWIDCEDGKGLCGDSEDNRLYISLAPLERRMIHTGLYFELPKHTELQVRPRSGTSLKQGLIVLNTPGTVDEKYRGEVCVIVINLSNEFIKIHNGDRIAQAVLMPVYNFYLTSLEKVSEINENTGRGKNGFGSSGTK